MPLVGFGVNAWKSGNTKYIGHCIVKYYVGMISKRRLLGRLLRSEPRAFPLQGSGAGIPTDDA